MKLISVDAFVEAMNEHIRALIELWHKTSTPEMKTRVGRAAAVFSEAALIAKDLPQVDAVEVVRCRDCRLMRKDSWDNAIFCDEKGKLVEPEDYCSRGERIEDGERD